MRVQPGEQRPRRRRAPPAATPHPWQKATAGPATFFMGFGFPILQRAIQGDPELSGRRVGLLQAANIAGCTLGSLVAGLFLFDAIGSAGVFRLLGSLGLAVAVVGAYRLKARSLWAIGTVLGAGPELG